MTVRSSSPPKIFLARPTATDATLAAPWPTGVSDRTFPPTARADWKSLFKIGPTKGRAVDAFLIESYASFTWPWISASPNTNDSKPAVTLYRCSAASAPE